MIHSKWTTNSGDSQAKTSPSVPWCVKVPCPGCGFLGQVFCALGSVCDAGGIPFNVSKDCQGWASGNWPLMGGFSPQRILELYWDFSAVRAGIPLLLADTQGAWGAEWCGTALSLLSPGFGFVACAFFKSRPPKRLLHTWLFFISFAFIRIVLYSFHSLIDPWGEEAPRGNDK